MTKILAPIYTPEEVKGFIDGLPEKQLKPLWTQMSKMVPPMPNPKASVTQWKYKECEPLLLKSGDVVEAEDAERRVLMLINKTMDEPHTTDTIYGGLQLILPNEIAPAHRHVAFAMRFIIQSAGGFTAVEGKKIIMDPGDVILTPSWCWHDHGNEGTEPVIWLDGLDLPLFTGVPVNFAEMYGDKRYPSELVEDCDWKFPWSLPVAAFATQPGPHKIYHYSKRDGSNLSHTLNAQAEEVAVGASSTPSQETISFIYHIFKGKGHSVIEAPDQECQVVEWEAKDTFAVPAWSKVQHFNEGDVPAWLFAVNDRPWIDNLGLYRKA